MSIAEKYFKEQMKFGEFRRSYLEEKSKLDIEYRGPSGVCVLFYLREDPFFHL